MPAWLEFLFYLAAFICFVLAVFSATAQRANFVAVGLALWVLVLVIHAFDRMT